MRDFTTEIENSLEVLLKLESKASRKTKLFDKEKNICLRVAVFKIPIVYGVRKKYLHLVHSRFGDNPETCLFVPNRKSKLNYKITTDEGIDLTINYYKNFLEKHKIEEIKTIMPLKQLQSEYNAYELRRKLVNRFDLFLCKNSLLYNSRFTNSLGKFFYKKNKEPLGISFPASDAPYDPKFNEKIKRAIYSTALRIKPYADNYAIPIGMLSQSKVILKDNLKAILEQIQTKDIIPGGFKNVRALYLGTSEAGNVPIYISTDIPANIGVPRLKRTRKRVKTVVGEINSLLYKKVIVKPRGTVYVVNQKSKKFHRNDFDNDKDFIDESEEEVENDERPSFKLKKNKNEESESEDDEEVEKQEKWLLKQKNLFEGNIDESEAEDKEDEESEIPRKKPKNKNKKKKVEKQSDGKIGKPAKSKKLGLDKIKEKKTLKEKKDSSISKKERKLKLKEKIKNKQNARKQIKKDNMKKSKMQKLKIMKGKKGKASHSRG